MIKVSLGNLNQLSKLPNENEWEVLLNIVNKQAITGVTFDALDKLSKNGQKPPVNILYKWLALSEQIKQQNTLVNKRCIDITTLFAKAGFISCILKGQGNALMYPNPLSRTPGDIDLWVFGDRDEITRFVKARKPLSFEQYHHIDFDIFGDVPVEVHYTPGRLLNPLFNKRFQNWCNEQKDLILKEYPDTITIVYPSLYFNIVYQMAHIMIHFFIEGIGLRHFIDYYYVLVKADGVYDKNNVRKTFQDLGLLRFASGVMWIEKELLGLEDKYLIVDPSEKLGLIIKKEIEEGGNLGLFDKRYNNVRSKGLIARGTADVCRLLHLATVFPSETFWKIINKIENQRWKIKALKKEKQVFSE